MNLGRKPPLGFWNGRAATIPALTLWLVIAGVCFSEMRFNWIEWSIGTYLTSTNTVRPETGAVWEKDRQASAARQRLEKIVTDRVATRRELQVNGTFTAVLDTLEQGQGVFVSGRQLLDLYGNAPTLTAAGYLSPYRLLRYSSGNRLKRAYLKKTGSGMTIYLLGGENMVLEQITVEGDVLQRQEGNGSTGARGLDGLARFRGRIYDAALFFEMLESMPEEIRRGVIPDPEALFGYTGILSRVAISSEIRAGIIEVGVEFTHSDHLEVISLYGQEWAVWRLRYLLEQKG